MSDMCHHCTLTGEGASPSLRSGSEQGGVCGRCGEGLCRPVANDLAGDTLDRLWEGCSPTPVFGNRTYRVREETARRSCHLAVKRSWKSGRPLATSVAIGLSQMPSTPVQTQNESSTGPDGAFGEGTIQTPKTREAPCSPSSAAGGVVTRQHFMGAGLDFLVCHDPCGAVTRFWRCERCCDLNETPYIKMRACQPCAEMLCDSKAMA